MWVSKRRFNRLSNTVGMLFEKIGEHRNRIETLEKQIKCSCENYEVKQKEGCWCHIDIMGGITDAESPYEKRCLDCGLVIEYDTKEEALADKQELLDRQISELKEQKKELKK